MNDGVKIYGHVFGKSIRYIYVTLTIKINPKFELSVRRGISLLLFKHLRRNTKILLELLFKLRKVTAYLSLQSNINS